MPLPSQLTAATQVVNKSNFNFIFGFSRRLLMKERCSQDSFRVLLFYIPRDFWLAGWILRKGDSKMRASFLGPWIRYHTEGLHWPIYVQAVVQRLSLMLMKGKSLELPFLSRCTLALLLMKA